MELQHRFTVPMGVPEAWEAFNDLERIAPCFPGAQITSVDGDDFTGVAKVKVGPISLQYTGSGRWVERDEVERRAVIEASGRDKRGNGTAGATIRARLEAEGAGTAVVLDTDLRITGRPAQFGRGVIQDVGNQLLGQFADCLAATLAGAPDDETDGVTDGVADDGTTDEQVAVASQAPTAHDQPADVSPSPRTDEPISTQPAQATTTDRPPPTPAPDELDITASLGPVLLKRFGPVVAAAAALAVGLTWLLRRRRR